MKKKIAFLLAAVMLFGATVGATIAWLQAETDQVRNTFTYGKIAIELDEAEVDEYGVPNASSDSRVDSNEYKLVPGHTYTKDPTVYVKNGSEKCWVFAKVAVSEEVANVIEELVINKEWIALGDEYPGVYYYQGPVDVSEEDGDDYFEIDPAVFDSFTVKDDADVSKVTAEDAITIDAYAVQYDNFETAAVDAWTATFGKPSSDPVSSEAP